MLIYIATVLYLLCQLDMLIAGCCFQQNSAQATANAWIVNVTAVDTRYLSIPSLYITTISFPSAFNISVDHSLPPNQVCQPPRVSDNDISISAISCRSTNSEAFVAGFILTSASNSTTSPAVKSLVIDSNICSALTTCNSMTALDARDVQIGSQIYPKWAVALTSVVVAAIVLCTGIVIIKTCVSRQRRAARRELTSEYSDFSRRPTDNSSVSPNEKQAVDKQNFSRKKLDNNTTRNGKESNQEAYQQLPDVDGPIKTGKLPTSASFQRLALGSKTLLTSLPSLPTLPKLPSFSTLPLFLSNSSSSQDNSLKEEIEPFRPKVDSPMLLDCVSESSASSSTKNNSTARSKTAVDAHKVIRRASRKLKTRSTIFTEENINKIFQLDDRAKHRSLNELYLQYGDILNKSTTTLCSGINSSTPSSVRVKHGELAVLEGMQAALIERSMSASNVIDQSENNDSNVEDSMPYVASDQEDIRPKARNQSNSLNQGLSKTFGDFDNMKAKSSEDFHSKCLEFRGRQRVSVCSTDAKCRSQFATPSASSTIRPRSFLLPRSIYDEDSSDDNSDTITRVKFQRQFRPLSRADSQKSYSTRRRSRPTSCMSNSNDVDTIRKYLRDSWKAELSKSQSQDSLTIDADLPPVIPRVQRRPPIPEGFMSRRSDRFSRPDSIVVEPIPEPEPTTDLTSQGSLDTLSSFVPQQGYTSEDTESISYSNAVSFGYPPHRYHIQWP